MESDLTKLSKEELVILQNIQYALDNVGSIDFGDFSFDDIQGLLDLYQKEKEKNEFFQKLFSVSQNRKRKNRTMDYKKINSSNKTGMNGVCQDMRAMKRTGKVKYRAYITLWGRQFSLGSHSSLEEAKKARANGEEMVRKILEEE